MSPAWRRAILAVALGLATGAQAPAPQCNVPAFRRGAQGGVVDASMSVVNNGAACRIRLWADVEARRPYDTIVVTRAPARGTVAVMPDGIAYRPNPGHAGPDVFEFTATGTGRQGFPTGGAFRVSVSVTPPP